MPSWSTHLVTANKVNKIINIDKNEFGFGNIMPDILEGYLIKDLSHHVRYSAAHFAKIININGIDIAMPDIDKFEKQYKNQMNNPIICGYYCHLITDYFWNEYTYKNHFKKVDKDLIEVTFANKEKKILNWNEAVKTKQKDFTNFSYFLKENNEIYYPSYTEKIYNEASKVKEINLTRSDIKKAIEHIEKNIKNRRVEDLKEDYIMFSKEELEQKFNESYEFISKRIKNKGKSL